MRKYFLDYFFIKISGKFDERYYLETNQDVRLADIDPLWHFVRNGWREGRNPSPTFNCLEYLEVNTDVKKAGMNPLLHFIKYGRKEGRIVSKDLTVPSPIHQNLSNNGNETGKPAIKSSHVLSSRQLPLLVRIKNAFRFIKANGINLFLVKELKKITPTESIPNSSAANPVIANNENQYEKNYLNQLAIAVGADKSEYVDFKINYTGFPPLDVKLIAFYLPQFHPIPENDAWWGKGFTEWTNVSKAVPQFDGHYQPHLPGELGFYDLRVPAVQRRQVELAKNYGIFGFCFHYYWFKGKRLLELPLQNFIGDPEIDFPFCICWANENWTRRWDGYESDVLMAQEHTPETDLAFIQDVIPLFKHKNYLKINGHPILVIYRVELIPEPQKTAALWKEICAKAGIDAPYLIAAQTFGFTDPRKVGFDAAVEFPPHNIWAERITDKVNLLNKTFSGDVLKYSGEGSLSDVYASLKHSGYQAFKTVTPGWDNEPRKPGRGSIFAFSTPETYKNWLIEACNYAKSIKVPDERIVFINAWNEWGEGAYLEPDRRFGYAYLQATYDTLNLYAGPGGLSQTKWTILFVLHDAHIGGAQILLKNIINWLSIHTNIHIKLLFLDDGELLNQYKEIADTLVIDTVHSQSEKLISDILQFCDGKPDLIYGNTVAVGKVYEQLARIDTPIVTHIHELEMSIRRYAGDAIGPLTRNSDHFISVSEAVSHNLINAHHVAPEAISRVYGGILAPGESQIILPEQKLVLRNQLGLPLNKKVVIGCGRGMPFRKGADLFIEVGKIVQNKLPGDTCFIWVGDFDPYEFDGESHYWKDFLQELNANGDIRFLGYRESVKQYLQAADLFLMTSREDPFPLVVLEAALCGLPVICFDDAGGAKEFVGDDAGRIVPFCDTLKMSEAVIEILANDSLRSMLGQNGSRKVEHHHTIEVVSPQILSVCRRVAEKAPAVSVIVPNYNHGKYLEERLDSIFSQTFRDFEVIILDDASTDNSIEVIKRYSDRADVRVIRNDSNSGSPFRQWRKGIEQAQSDLVWIAESDDRCENTFLEALLPAFRDPNLRLAYANSWIIDSYGNVTGDYLTTNYLNDLSPTKWNRTYKISAEEEINDGLGIKNTILNISSAVFRKPVFENTVFNVMESMRYAGDWWFIVNMICGGTVFYESRKLNYHRRHEASVIGDLIKHNRVEGFYGEIATIHKKVCSLYSFEPAFLSMWTSYTQNQWNAFFPSAEMDDLKKVYPYEEIANLIESKSYGN